jgi:signal transduction histidine kinase
MMALGEARMSRGASGTGWRPGWARPLPPLVADGLLACGLGLLSVMSALSDRRRGANVPALGLVLLVALVPALLVRRRLPGTSLAAVAGLQIGMLALGMPPGANFAAELVAPYSVAAHGSRRMRLATAAAAGVALVIIALPRFGRWSRGDALALMIAGAGAWLVGSVLRERRAGVAELAERTARLERERELEARRAAAEERLRIARELHDVVAHNLSVVVVQAQAAQRILDRDSERARGVVVSIERTGREALDEMRRLLGVLRAGEPSTGTDAEEDGLFGPQPGLARIGDLVEQVGRAGLPVTVRVEGTERPLTAAIDLSAFRIVQEALTNSLKHAGPARAEVVLRYRPDHLELTVSDDGRGGSAALDGGPVPRSGHGLVGMRERVELFGGDLAAGPRQGGGYQVRARLPLEVAPA